MNPMNGKILNILRFSVGLAQVFLYLHGKRMI